MLLTYPQPSAGDVTASTAQPPAIHADVLPLIPAARERLRAEKLNCVAKRDRLSQVLDRMNCFDWRNDETREHRRLLWAEYYAVKEVSEICDLDGEARSWLLCRAREALPEWERYSKVLATIEDIEQDNEDTEKTKTWTAVKQRNDESRGAITNYLSYALTTEQILLVSEIQARSPWRRSSHFRLEHLQPAHRRALDLTDAPIRAPYITLTLGDLVDRSKTLKEIRALLAIWDVTYRVKALETGHVVITDLFEIRPK